ncbi:ABC transporter ATP-binding protein [Arhodomonas aquaeolei]|uniref:ABC transporter ATP-binding protein n=1 Tax=Arhodomonas aquaeolei TaxID=2369 RepID=UPI00036F9491|nr:ATP-binding cassette domain-containing protein [Arhodomonas aquaeolei]
MAAPVIEARDLVTEIGGRRIHDGLDLRIERGELMAIAGSSGSGKTVLIRALTLLLPIAGGEIRLFDAPVTGLNRAGERRLRRRMALMFQRGALFTGMTVLENVMMPLAEHTRLPLGLRREIARVKIRLAGLEPDAAHRYPGELSGGMTKRAALARALALDPELLFLDEPTAGLDPVSAAAFDSLIRELRDLLGLTVVVVTHDVDSLWEIADSIAFIGEGRVLARGDAATLAESDEPAVRAYFSGTRMRRGRERSWETA